MLAVRLQQNRTQGGSQRPLSSPSKLIQPWRSFSLDFDTEENPKPLTIGGTVRVGSSEATNGGKSVGKPWVGARGEAELN
jgi:hypothetical protein